MFTVKRGKVVRMTHLMGIDARGGRRNLPHTLVGDAGLNQSRRQINCMVRAGKGEDLCRAAAGKLCHEEEFADVETVRVVTGEYHLDDYYDGDTEPLSERVRAAWPVEEAGR